jgi:hypothetical protein
VPRPIALVVTLGPQGPNAAPFSFFNPVCADPSMLMFSMAPREGLVMKDTIRNIEQCPEFVVHIVDELNREKMNICSADVPHGVNEIERGRVPHSAFREGAPAAHRRLPGATRMPPRTHAQARPQAVYPGNREIVLAHYREGIVDEVRHYVDVAKLSAMGRMEGADMYTRLTDRFSMPRPGNTHP